MSLDFQKLEFSFSKGLNQKADPRLTQEPELVRAVDVEFDDIGGLRLRYPYASIGENIFGGGTISDCRRIYAVGSELILFTKTALYSWSSQLSAWVLKGTHLAIKVDEESAFASTSEQVDASRALLNGTVVYCWREAVAAADTMFVAAADATTGAVLLAPTAATTGTRGRVVALGTTFILLYEDAIGALVGRTINPLTLDISGTTTILAAAFFNSHFDVEKIPGSDTAIVACRRDVTTSYEIIKVWLDSPSLDLTKITKARTCDGPIAITCTPDGNYAQIIRANSTNIQGDLVLISTLADVNTGQALGTGTSTINQVTGAFVDSTTCHAFWNSNETTGSGDFDIDTNTVTVANVVGPATSLVRRLSIASRAFAYNGKAYVWTVFAGTSSFSGSSPPAFSAQLQSSYFLYRSDAHLAAKAVWNRAGGQISNCVLGAVTLSSGSTSFSWCGTERRVVPLGANGLQSAYSDRGPRDVTITFDSNEARRVAKIGETVYVTGGQVMAYDGKSLTECGFALPPWYFGAIEVGTGALTDGVRTIKVTYRYDNAKGERERSTTATHGQVTIVAGPNGHSIVSWPALYVTHKSGVAVEVWRTSVAGSVFFLATSIDPNSLTNPNRYIPNDPTASLLPTFNDEMADETLITKEPSPENDSILESLAPPAASIIVASADRLFLAGCAGDPHRVVYSKLRGDGEIAAFHDTLIVQIPEAGGDITGLAFLNETLVVFRETAVYALDGRGFGNDSSGQNFEARLVSSDCGAVNHESIALTPSGLIFKSSKGWYVLNRGWSVQYIGGPVVDYDAETVHAAHVVESQHQLRIVTASRVLVYDYLVEQWAEWSITDGLHACVWNGAHHVLATAAVRGASTSYATADYAWDIEMLVHLGGLQGFSRVRKILVLGEVRGAGTIRFRVGKYAESTYFDDKTWTISPVTVGSELEVKHGPSQQQHKAIRIRLTSQATAGEKPKLSALSLELGLKPGTFRHLPSAQRQ